MANMDEQEGNWLQRWIINAVGPKKKKHRKLDDEDERPSNLFKEVNQLRHQPMDDPHDADALERAKYKDDVFGQIAGSKVFEFTTLGLISCNALAIGVDADYSATVGKPDNLNEGPIGFIIVEWIFCTYFTIEVLVRFLAYKHKCHVFCDAWFVFDSVLVSFMILETWVLPFMGGGGPMGQLSILRLLRLLRITRMARLMRAVPEMMVIVKGMVASTRTVCCTGSLLALILYIFSILFTDAFHETPELGDSDDEPEYMQMFGTMGKSMFTLFIMGTVLDDVTAASNAIRASGNFWMLAAFIICILISSFMMLNMLIGVLVEIVGATAQGEKEQAVELNVREAISSIFEKMDADSNKEISMKEFLGMKDDERVMKALAELDITAPHFNLYAELFFRAEESGVTPSLTYDKLVSMILRLRPGSFVSALDFAAFAKSITGIHDRVKERVTRLDSICEEMARPYMGSPLSISEEGTPPMLLPAGSPTADQVLAFQVSPSVNSLASPAALPQEDKDRLERISNLDIVEELQRRLGMADLEKTGVPYSMMDEEMQNKVKKCSEEGKAGEEAFMTLGVPQNDEETVYV